MTFLERVTSDIASAMRAKDQVAARAAPDAEGGLDEP